MTQTSQSKAPSPDTNPPRRRSLRFRKLIYYVFQAALIQAVFGPGRPQTPSGTVTVTVVPEPGHDRTEKVPPTSSARSAIDNIP